MADYHSYDVSLSKGQLQKISRAYNNNSAITIRLANKELSGPDELMLTKTQVNKLKEGRAKVWVHILKHQKHKYEKQ